MNGNNEQPGQAQPPSAPSQQQPAASAPPAPSANLFTQEQLNAILGQRLQEERAKYADYGTLKTQVTDLGQQLATAQANAQAATLNAMRFQVALATGLNPALVSRLQGNTEAELKADAEALLALFKGQSPAAPTPQPQPPAAPAPQPQPTPTPASPATQPVLTLDMIRKMTPQQVQENLPAVLAVLERGAK